MLALDRSIGCIEASEPDVLALYRSGPVLTTLTGGKRPETCEAYVCAIRKNRNVQVYFALVADDRKILVYTPKAGMDTQETYPVTLMEALEFAGSMGFSPERIDLNYSPAMREVVVRNIKILRPPGSKTHALLRYGTANAPTGKKDGAALSATVAAPAYSHVNAAPEIPLSLDIPESAESPVLPAAPAFLPDSAAKLPARAASSGASPDASSSVPAGGSPVAPESLPLPAAPPGAGVPAPPPATVVLPLPGAAAEPSPVLETALSRPADDARIQLKRVAEEEAALKKELARTLAEQQRDQELLTTLRAQLAESQSALEKKEAQAVAERGRLEKAQKALEHKLQEVSARHAAVDAEAATARADAAALRCQLETLTLRLETLVPVTELAALQQEAARLAEELDRSKRVNEELAEERGRSRQRNEQLTEELDQSRQLKEQLTEELEQSRQLNEQLAEQRDRSRELEEQVAGERDQVGHLRDRLLAQSTSQTKALSRAQEEQQKLAVELDRTRLQAEQLGAEKEALLAQTHDLKAKVDAQGVLLEKTHRKADRLERESCRRKDELQALRDAVVELSAERDAALQRAADAEREAVAPKSISDTNLKKATAEVTVATGSAIAQAREEETVATGSDLEKAQEKEAVEAACDTSDAPGPVAAEHPTEPERPTEPEHEPEPLQEVTVPAAMTAAPPVEREKAWPGPGAMGAGEPHTWPQLGDLGSFSFDPLPVVPVEPASEAADLPPAAAPLPAAAPPLAAAPPPAAAGTGHPGPGNSTTEGVPVRQPPHAVSSWFLAPQCRDEAETVSSDPFEGFFPPDDDTAACPGRFLLQPRETHIRIGPRQYVVELLQSINAAQVSPEGKGQVSCQGYICCLQEETGEIRVFTALFAPLTGKSWVYHPEVQPRDREDHARALAGAIDFAEGVGFMMEQAKLDSEGKAVARCPVLSQGEG